MQLSYKSDKISIGDSMHIELKKYNIKTQKKLNIKIAHISDIHFSLDFNLKRLELIKEHIKKYSPNYICITGDLIDTYNITKDKSIIKFEEFLNELSKISKVIISIGNHEYMDESEEKYNEKLKMDWLKKIKNITILDNEIKIENDINFIGFNPSIEFYKKNETEIIKEDNLKLYKLINKLNNNYSILLCHTPIYFTKNNNYKKIKDLNKINLILSGHTHGGMVPSFIPGNFGIIEPSKKFFPKNIRGKINLDGITLIISSGITKLSRKSKLMKFTDIYGENINEININ